MTPRRITSKRGSVTCVLAVLLLVLPAAASGQIQSITARADYAFAMKKRLNVQSATAIGGGVEMRVKLYEGLSLGVAGAYQSYTIEQSDALAQWNWVFWNDRYYPKIQSDMRADPNLSAQIGSAQSMDAIPVMLSFIYNLEAGSDFLVAPRVSGGVVFFTRKLYVDETWTKQYPQAGHSLTYNLRNFAPDKNGNVVSLALGCDAAYAISADVKVSAGAEYRSYLSSSSGYELFPFENECLITLGLTFLF